ncbi:MAG: hypothetical protein CME33_30730 [Gimesia sp.]|nr:hypothetical protein [Gimesia sp.]
MFINCSQVTLNGIRGHLNIAGVHEHGMVPDAIRYERSEQEVPATAIGTRQCRPPLQFRK